MKITLVTNAIKEQDFALYLSKGLPANPSSQNFYQRIVDALSDGNELSIISIPPNWDDSFVGDEKWHYYRKPKGRINQLILFPNKVAANASFAKDSVVIYNSLNVTCAKIATALSKRYGVKRAAILTDNPANITGVSKAFINSCLKASKKADGYIALSESLASLFGKPSSKKMIIEGIAEDFSANPKENKKYIYMAGALYPRYGVDALVEAFHESSMDCDLIIGGHGPSKEKVISLSKIDPRIRFIGQVSKEDNITLECGSSLLVNPRPFDHDLDKNSIPSKMIEYLMTGKPILSANQTRLKELFQDDVNWIPGLSVKDELSAFFLANPSLEGIKSNDSKNKALSLFGYKAFNEKVVSFLETL